VIRKSNTVRTCALRLLLGAAWLVVALPAGAQMDCTDCHDVDIEAFADGIHGFVECTECHAGAEEIPHAEGSMQAGCALCHDDVVLEYNASVHGTGAQPGLIDAPKCDECHGPTHTLLPSSDPASPVHRERLADTCSGCHADPEALEQLEFPIARPLEAYEASVHARGLIEGQDAATCNDCHGSHAIFRPPDPRSSVFHARVPGTCGQCHGEIEQAYRESVHGKASKYGVREAPVCTDCHGEHRILSPLERGSPIYATNIPKMVCGRCHGDLRLVEKYGLSVDTVSAYDDSYHGLASRAGKATVASCASCHGVHDTLPSSDPRSHVHADNLAATCGKCHPGAGTKFAIGSVHTLPTQKEFPAVYYTRVVYLWLIYLTVGGMVVHNLLDLYRKAKMPPPTAYAVPTQPDRPRMLLGFRLAHGLLGSSFIVLGYTGFALKYPEAWWAKPFVLLESGLDVRGGLHRAAAVAMLLALGLHMVHLVLSVQARRCIAKMRPGMEDLRELGERLSYYVGRRRTPPAAPELGYPEKLEYLALMWGILIMTVTGFALWLDDFVLHYGPKWITDLATVIHFYEAVLATLAIIVWHFYFVIFDPVVYPMDTAWLTGQAPRGRLLEREAHVSQEPPPPKGK